MCIFSKDVHVEDATKIFVGRLTNTRRLLAYSNKVTVTEKGGAVMCLPIPTKGSVIFHDTRDYKDFMEDLSSIVFDNAVKTLKSKGHGFPLDKFKTVGIHKMALVETQDVVSTLISLKQPVFSWMYGLLEAYKEYKWVFVVIPQGKSLAAQPLMIEYEQSINPLDLYFPMMDIHGEGEIQKTVSRQYFYFIGDTEISPKTGAFKHKIESFPWDGLFNYHGDQMGVIGNIRIFQNGDLWASPYFKPFEDEPSFKLRWETPYQL